MYYAREIKSMLRWHCGQQHYVSLLHTSDAMLQVTCLLKWHSSALPKCITCTIRHAGNDRLAHWYQATLTRFSTCTKRDPKSGRPTKMTKHSLNSIFFLYTEGYTDQPVTGQFNLHRAAWDKYVYIYCKHNDVPTGRWKVYFTNIEQTKLSIFNS